MKKFLWIALLLALSLAFAACPEDDDPGDNTGVICEYEDCDCADCEGEGCECKKEDGGETDGRLVIENPTPTRYLNPNIATDSLTIGEDGTVSVNTTRNDYGMGFWYALPADWADYATITIEYNADTTSSPTQAKVGVKKGSSLDAIASGAYKNIENGEGKILSWPVSAFAGTTDARIGFQVNNYAAADVPQEWTFKVTKITLTPAE